MSLLFYSIFSWSSTKNSKILEILHSAQLRATKGAKGIRKRKICTSVSRMLVSSTPLKWNIYLAYGATTFTSVRSTWITACCLIFFTFRSPGVSRPWGSGKSRNPPMRVTPIACSPLFVLVYWRFVLVAVSSSFSSFLCSSLFSSFSSLRIYTEIINSSGNNEQISRLRLLLAS